LRDSGSAKPRFKNDKFALYEHKRF
jgi:hypothetical protein